MFDFKTKENDMNMPTDIVKINYIAERKVDFFSWCRENRIAIIVNEREEKNQRVNQFYATTKQMINVMKDGTLYSLPMCVGFTPETAVNELAHYLSDSMICVFDTNSIPRYLNVPALGFDIN